MLLETLAALTAAFAPDTPSLVQRKEVPYLGIESTETMASLPTLFKRQMPKLGAYLAAHKIKPAGAPFIKYVTIKMPGRLDVVLGVPVAKKTAGSDGIAAGVLPKGRYARLVFYGEYSGLEGANRQLQTWCASHHLEFPVTRGANGDTFVSRFESYETDPSRQKDPSKWRTDVIYMVKSK